MTPKCTYSGCEQPLLSVVLLSGPCQDKLLVVKNERNTILTAILACNCKKVKSGQWKPHYKKVKSSHWKTYENHVCACVCVCVSVCACVCVCVCVCACACACACAILTAILACNCKKVKSGQWKPHYKRSHQVIGKLMKIMYVCVSVCACVCVCVCVRACMCVCERVCV